MTDDNAMLDPPPDRDSEGPTHRLDPDLAFDDAMLHEVLAYWHEIRGTRAMPRRDDLDPIRLPRRAMATVALTDIEHQPELRFRWRLLGTGITHRLGRDVTGLYWDGLYDPRIYEWFTVGPRWLIEHRRPLRLVSSVPLKNKDYLIYESVELPFSDDGDRVSMIMAVVSIR